MEAMTWESGGYGTAWIYNGGNDVIVVTFLALTGEKHGRFNGIAHSHQGGVNLPQWWAPVWTG